MPTLEQLQQTIETKSGELAALFAAHRTEDGNSFKDGLPIKEVNDRNDELTQLGKELDAARLIDDADKQNQARVRASSENKQDGSGSHIVHANGSGSAADMQGDGVKSLGQAFVESAFYLARKAADGDRISTKLHGLNVELPRASAKTAFMMANDPAIKATLTTAAGFAPFVPRIPRVILSAQRRPVVSDLIPSDDTTASAIKYMEETTFTNNAAAVAEGATKPEAVLVFTERTVPMTKVAVSLPVTEEQLADVPQIRALIDNRLTLMLQLEEERELLNGSGAGSEMTGFYNKAGVLTQAKGADDRFTALYKMITKVRSTTGFADPTGTVMHPNDWQTLRTTQDTTGRFILGDPGQEGPERLWSLPLVPTIAATAGAPLLGDFQMFAHIDRREGIRFDVGYVNDQFIKNIQTILAEFRETLEIYRAAAFCIGSGF
jgi:HK97 family phage major capsid protein